MFTRASAALGANWSLHDLRHTAAYRMARDPAMPLTDVQWVLGHAHLSTTQQLPEPAARRRDRERAGLPRSGSGTAGPQRRPAAGYRAESLRGAVRRGRAVTAAGHGRQPATAAVAEAAPSVADGDRSRSCWPGSRRGRSPRHGRRPSAGRHEVLARLLAPPFAAGQSAQPADPAARPGRRAELAGSPARRHLAGAVAGQRRRGRSRTGGAWSPRWKAARSGAPPGRSRRTSAAG